MTIFCGIDIYALNTKAFNQWNVSPMVTCCTCSMDAGEASCFNWSMHLGIPVFWQENTSTSEAWWWNKTHSQERERNFLFDDTLNTFYLRLYGVRHMVKDHSDSEKGNPLPPHRLLFYRLAARVLLYAPSHRQDNAYHGLCYTSRGALAGTRNSSIGPPHEGSIQWPIAPWANALPLSYVPLLPQSITDC